MWLDNNTYVICHTGDSRAVSSTRLESELSYICHSPSPHGDHRATDKRKSQTCQPLQPQASPCEEEKQPPDGWASRGPHSVVGLTTCGEEGASRQGRQMCWTAGGSMQGRGGHEDEHELQPSPVRALQPTSSSFSTQGAPVLSTACRWAGGPCLGPRAVLGHGLHPTAQRSVNQ